MALKVGELYASFGIDTSGVSRAMGTITASVGDVSASFMALGGLMTSKLTQPIVDAAKSALNAAMDFDQAMSSVAAIAGIDNASEAYTELRETALAYSASTKFTANEVADALYYMGLAGWNTQEMISGLPGLLAMGAASGEDLSTVSDILTDDLTAMGEGADQAARYANIFAAASANSNTTIAQMGEAMKYIGPVAGALGFTMEDTALAIGLLANNGIKGSQAGTSLRRLLTNMAKPTKQTAEAMEALGISLNDGTGNAKPMYDFLVELREIFNGDWVNSATGQMVTSYFEQLEASAVETADGIEYDKNLIKAAAADMKSYLSDLGIDVDKVFPDMTLGSKATIEDVNLLAAALMSYNKSAEGIDPMNAARFAAQLAGQYGMTGFLALVNSSEEDLMQLKEAIDGSNEGEGTAFTLMQTQLDNLAGDITILQSAWEALQISLADLVMPTLRELTQELTGWVDYFRELPDSTKKTALKMLGLAAATGPVILGAGKIITYAKMLTPLLTGMFTPMGLITGTLLLFGAAALDADNDIGSMLETLSTKAADALTDVADGFADKESEIETNMTALIDSINNSVSTLLPVIIDAGGNIITSLLTMITNQAAGVAGIGTNIIVTLLNSIQEQLPTLVPALVSAAGAVVSALISTVSDVAPEVIDFGVALINTIVDNIPAILDILTEQGPEIVNGLSSIMLSLFDGLGSIFENIADNAPEILDGLIDLFSTIFQALVDNAPDLLAGLGTFLGKAIGSLAGIILSPDTWDKLFSLGGLIVKGLVDGIWNIGKGLVEGVWNALVEFWQACFGKSKAEFDEIYGEWSAVAQDNELAAEWGMRVTSKAPETLEELESLMEAYKGITDEYDSVPSDFEQYAYILDSGVTKLYETLLMSDYSGKGNSNVSKKVAALIALQELGYEVSGFLAGMSEDVQDLFDGYDESDVADAFSLFGIGQENTKEAEQAARAAEALTESVTTLTEQEVAMYASLEAASAEFYGTEGGGGMVTAIENGQNAVVEAAAKLGSEVVNEALKALTYSEGYAAGSTYVSGIVDGINASLGSVAAAAQNVSSTFAANLSIPSYPGSGGSTSGAKSDTTGLANGIAAALKSSPITLTQDGKTVATINSGYNAQASNNRTQSYALGYGK